MVYLLDTCVISELVRQKPHPPVADFISSEPEDSFAISAITMGELQKGIDKLVDSKRKRQLRHWFTHDLLPRFEGRILAFDAVVAMCWGTLLAETELRGRILPAVDSQIAAIALSHRLKLVTRNTRDFDGTGVDIVNPWDM